MTSLRDRREKAGLSQKEVADRANTSQPQIMRLERGDRKLTKEWAERLGPIYGVTAGELLFGTSSTANPLPSGPIPVRSVPVRGNVQAGVWTEFEEFPDLAGQTIPSVPGRYEHLEQWAYRVSGPSMTKARLFEGDYVICVPYFLARGGPVHGDLAVIERRRGGTTERTVKQIEVDDKGACQLWPRSDDPRFQTPILCNGPEPDGTEIEITGYVIGSFTPR